MRYIFDHFSITSLYRLELGTGKKHLSLSQRGWDSLQSQRSEFPYHVHFPTLDGLEAVRCSLVPDQTEFAILDVEETP